MKLKWRHDGYRMDREEPCLHVNVAPALKSRTKATETIVFNNVQ